MNYQRSKSGRLIVPDEGVRGYRPSCAEWRDDKPELALPFWGGESGFKFRAAHDSPVRMYEHNPYGAEGGGVEYEQLLLTRPPSNVIEYDFDSWGLNFFHQGPLTKEEKRYSAVRPGHILNSYAVYHESKRSRYPGQPDYGTGKACHIYRAWAKDLNGWRVWCDLRIHRNSGTMTCTLPAYFWTNAAYPVVLDPTIGYTTIGGSTIGFQTFIVACRYASPGAGDANTGTFYVAAHSNGNGAQTSGVGAYASSGSSPSGQSLLSGNAGTVVINNTTGQFYSGTFTWTGILASTDYFLSFWANGTNHTQYYDTGTAGYNDTEYKSNGGYTSPMPATYPTGLTSQAWQMSIKLDYTAAAAGGGPCNLMTMGVGKCAAPIAGLEWLRHRKNRIRRDGYKTRESGICVPEDYEEVA